MKNTYKKFFIYVNLNKLVSNFTDRQGDITQTHKIKIKEKYFK